MEKEEDNRTMLSKKKKDNRTIACEYDVALD